MVAISSSVISVLVVGATGNTGKHVVRQLLDQGHQVNVIVRSKQRMLDVLPQASKKENNDIGDEKLDITERVLLDMSDNDFDDHLRNVDAVVQCLGHTMDFKGIFGHPRKLVTDATDRITKAMMRTSNVDNKKKFILMGSDGVSVSNVDDKLSFTERTIFWLIRNLLPPHSDNEGAAETLIKLGSTKTVEWAIVRPSNLIDGDASEYRLSEKQSSSPIFGMGVTTRANVAKFMTDLITQPNLWDQWKFKFPVVYDLNKAENQKSNEL